ncbi:unnamed protein product [Mycena citricolor]|uniref:FAD-binding domain-containing protein n=1 Tax=Mycena citricolor TaxID=2018698 RepID=A0AAD2JYX6_9AGAR|nr:unnamed protein product [Mycena citricolor]
MSSTPSPLKVTIVGGGVGGLSAAVALRQNGHIVQVFERLESDIELGAALSLQENAMRVLRKIGVNRESLRPVYARGLVGFNAITGESRELLLVPKDAAPGSTDIALVHRSDLHEELKRIALAPDGNGPPVLIRLGSKVVSCEPEAGVVVLDSGETISADLVIGADGLQSVIRSHVLGYVQDAEPTGYACCRSVFDAAPMKDNPDFDWITKGVPGARAVPWKGAPFRMIFCYLCRNGELLNCAHFFQESDEDKQNLTSRTITPAEVLPKFAGADPKFLRLFDLPNHNGEHYRWRLRAMPVLPTWFDGRTAILGDAAHAMVPFMAQGAAMAIEDGAVLAGLLPLGTTPEQIPARLAAWLDIRKPRAELMSKTSFAQIQATIDGNHASVHFEEARVNLMSYDALQTGKDAYQKLFA